MTVALAVAVAVGGGLLVGVGDGSGTAPTNTEPLMHVVDIALPSGSFALAAGQIREYVPGAESRATVI